MPKNSAYAVFVGRRPGVYTSWEQAKAQTNGFKHNSYKGFVSRYSAQAAYDKYVGRDKEQQTTPAKRPRVAEEDVEVIQSVSLEERLQRGYEAAKARGEVIELLTDDDDDDDDDDDEKEVVQVKTDLASVETQGDAAWNPGRFTWVRPGLEENSPRTSDYYPTTSTEAPCIFTWVRPGLESTSMRNKRSYSAMEAPPDAATHSPRYPPNENCTRKILLTFATDKQLRQIVGRVIGRGGASIASMRSQTGARITINSTTAEVTMTGTSEAVEKAAGLVLAAAADSNAVGANSRHESRAALEPQQGPD